jgi:hypothetical protein
MAWLRADRSLASLLKYKLPLSQRVRFAAIRFYWLADLLLSAVVALAYAPLAGLPGKLFETSLLAGLDADARLSYLSYPLVAIALGFFWPQISALTVSLGRGNDTAFRLSLGQLRDYLLGGPALDSINARLHLAVASYVDRVVEAATHSDDDSGPAILEALGLAVLSADRQQLRQALMKRAQEDGESLYAAVSSVKMIPFVERRRPLMMVPDMTAHEEEKLYRAGIETVGDLLREKPVRDIGLSPERMAVLRLGARRLVAQRLWFGLGVAGIAGSVIGLGSLSLGLYHEEKTPTRGAPFALGAAAVVRSNAEGRP